MKRFDITGLVGGHGRWVCPALPLIACAVVLLLATGCHDVTPSAIAAQTSREQSPGVATGADTDTKVLVTYFHNTFRCPTCKKLEAYSREAVESAFAERIAEGKLLFRVINVDDPENKHFVEDYKLYSKSLIVSLNKNGKEVRWKNLPDIWKHVRNRNRFEQYVTGEVEAFLKDL